MPAYAAVVMFGLCSSESQASTTVNKFLLCRNLLSTKVKHLRVKKSQQQRIVKRSLSILTEGWILWKGQLIP